MIKLFYTKQITENWAFEIELLKWFGSPGWFPIYENSLSAKIKGSHRGFYWTFYIIGLKVIELNVYDSRHDDEYENHVVEKKK
tara:strand:+ start:454 stop:702 length:249 start_codon:yes stop_codon:yes gene_type:complete